MFGCLPWGSSARILPFENPSEDSEDPICAICLESVFRRAINSLNNDIVACLNEIPHQFHRDCVENYRLHRGLDVPCPTCRSEFHRVRDDNNVFLGGGETSLGGENRLNSNEGLYELTS